MSAETKRSLKILVLAPFFHNSSANRPRIVAEVLAQFGSVDIVTTNFDHLTKRKVVPFEYHDSRTLHCLPTIPYRHNVSVARFISHFCFSIRAWFFSMRSRQKYDVIYASLPLNLIGWLVFWSHRKQVRIVDVIDIWPDVLPFTEAHRKLLGPVFRVWKYVFTRAVANADLLLAVSDRFLDQSLPFFQGPDSASARVYIGCQGFPKGKRVPAGRLTVVYIGNIGHVYDFDTLIEVMANSRDLIRLFIIGEGDRRPWLIEKLKEQEVSYEYFGAVYDPSRLSEIFAQCDVGFNGYRNTSAAFSYKANSYFAAGLPILNSMTGDLERLVAQHELGFNYISGDVDSLAHAVTQLTRARIDDLSRNVETFFASELELDQVKSKLGSFFCDNLP